MPLVGTVVNDWSLGGPWMGPGVLSSHTGDGCLLIVIVMGDHGSYSLNFLLFRHQRLGSLQVVCFHHMHVIVIFVEIGVIVDLLVPSHMSMVQI